MFRVAPVIIALALLPLTALGQQGGIYRWVDENGQVHGYDGLYVADAAAFPTNLGVNPQHTIMALACCVAEDLLEPRQA